MYAILETGGKQYKVTPEQVVEVEKLDFEKKDKVVLEKVLLFADGDNLEIGRPYLENVSVEAEVLAQVKAKKLVIFKYLRRKDSHTKNGHRQKITRLLINKINKV
ncbi:MAG: 50S ribosomal protein L21 [Candidatus Omnitrophota bacterium]|nr:MAG: 50S ribosomal protein L21 [Candidatus Omnitrophota bacterium]